MTMHKISLATFDTARFLIGGRPDAASAMSPSARLKVAYKRFHARTFHTLAASTKRPQQPVYADITNVIDRLEGIAKQGNWDLAKRLEVARMACENPTITFEQLDCSYDRGHRSVQDKARQNTPERPAHSFSAHLHSINQDWHALQ